MFFLQLNKGKAPLTYQSYLKVSKEAGPPAKPLARQPTIPKECQLGDKASSDPKYDPPTLKELGLDESQLEPCLFPGGESAALARLDSTVCEDNGQWVRAFEKPGTSPNALEPATTVLSPYLKFGCLSPRELYWRLLDVYGQRKHSQPPVSLLGQLHWREFYYVAAEGTPNFDKMKGTEFLIAREVRGGFQAFLLILRQPGMQTDPLGHE